MISVERSNEGPRQLLHTEALEQGLIKGSNPSSGCESQQGLDPQLPWIECQAMPKDSKYTN